MFNLDDLRVPDAWLRVFVHQQRRHALPWRPRSNKYIRPLPWDWISTAAKMPGAALRVAVLLGWQSGVQRRSWDLTIPTADLRKFRIRRHTYYQALQALEAAHLITVVRQPGRKARVAIVTTDRISGEKNEGANHGTR